VCTKYAALHKNKIHRALLGVCTWLFWVYEGFLSVHEALLSVFRALLSARRALLSAYRPRLSACRALLGVFSTNCRQ